MPTVEIGNFLGGTVRFEMDVDGANRITAVRCLNESGQDVGIELIQGEGFANAGRTTTMRRLGPGTSEFALPTGAAQRLVTRFDAVRGRWEGIDKRITVPWSES